MKTVTGDSWHAVDEAYIAVLARGGRATLVRLPALAGVAVASLADLARPGRIA